MPRSRHRDFRYLGERLSGLGDGEEEAPVVNAELDEVASIIDSVFVNDEEQELVDEMEVDGSDSHAYSSHVDLPDSDMHKVLSEIPTPVLLFVASSCISRLSNREFDRFLTSQEDDFAEAAESLWYFHRKNFSIHHFCNTCGIHLMTTKKCNCSDESQVSSFVRVGAFSQITELVQQFISEILALRKDLKNGIDVAHNLNSPFFCSSWKAEPPNHLHLSAVISIDGVNISGNSKKLWPVSLVLVDLPSGIMQKSANIVLLGVVECKETPSTTLWNSLWPMILTDVQSHIGKVGGITFDCSIRTCSADQPAKRTFFGMRSHHSVSSCFFCLSPRTLYKLDGYSREETRNGILTLQDSINGKNGFGEVPSAVVSSIYPYDTPIDLLHNFGEGIFEKIKKEIFPSDSKIELKSDLFRNEGKNFENDLEFVHCHSHFKNMEDCRNGTDKSNFFRLKLCLASLVSENISPKGRIVMINLGMVANKMYSNSSTHELFDDQMCASARWFLSEANEKYITIKAHEILYHLPEINRKFKNTGLLSTFSFESFYQFALCGYSTSVTRFFLQNACTKFLLHKGIRKELTTRSMVDPCRRLKKFLSETPDIVPEVVCWKNRIDSLKPEDFIPNVEGCTFFASISVPIGQLTSEYASVHTLDDMFFGFHENRKSCFRFVAAVVLDGSLHGILAEPVLPLERESQFEQFRKIQEVLDSNDLYYAKESLAYLQQYDGIVDGVLSKKRVVLLPHEVCGIACYIHSAQSTIFVQANGAFLHN